VPVRAVLLSLAVAAVSLSCAQRPRVSVTGAWAVDPLLADLRSDVRAEVPLARVQPADGAAGGEPPSVTVFCGDCPPGGARLQWDTALSRDLVADVSRAFDDAPVVLAATDGGRDALANIPGVLTVFLEADATVADWATAIRPELAGAGTDAVVVLAVGAGGPLLVDELGGALDPFRLVMVVPFAATAERLRDLGFDIAGALVWDLSGIGATNSPEPHIPRHLVRY